MVTRIRHETRIVRGVKRFQDKIADSMTRFAGSMKFVYLHTAWFGAWILLNLGALAWLGLRHKFDPYPFGLLTMVVSLEAIFLSTFVMISQNRQAARADIRSELDFDNNLRSEIWAVHIGSALGIDVDHVEETVRKVIEGYRKEMTVASKR
ncbi:MAG: DUF1003 domain-containing protein [Actinobacteria bacterium]|nr:DUF1003 domain-containing protein [Actinomycetota bacterium]